MNNPAFVISGFNIGVSEIILVLLAFFVGFLIVRNLIVYRFRPKDK
ncbi:hypothetical protein N824_23960 [Pedobacter sp. V48]|nr:hypothetical protein N824_23960 [Pedobacter sp. V48]